MNEILTFSLVALLLVISPGPNGVLILKTITAFDKKSAFANIVGVTSATFFHGAFSIFGLSALLLQSADIFFVVKLVGAAYLFYIGAKAIIHSFKKSVQAPLQTEPKASKSLLKNRSMLNFFAEGFLTQLLNPKVSMFYLAAFPQFVSFEHSSINSAFLLVAIHASLIFCWFVGLINVFHKIKQAGSSKKSHLGRWLQRFSGSVMIYFSSLLLLQK